jgi:hypothetical protein
LRAVVVVVFTFVVVVRVVVFLSSLSWSRWDGDRSTQLQFDPVVLGWQTSDGTVPVGSTWRKDPIPSVLWEREVGSAVWRATLALAAI